MRINQFVASASGLSRRAADTAITAGRVKLNGRPATLGQIIAPTDHLTLDEQPLTPRTAHTYVMLNKPAGYISSRARQGGGPTLYELLPAKFGRLRIAGRLDRDSSGLILLSDDGPFINRLTHPSLGKTKRYELTLTTALKPSDQPKLSHGIQLPDGPSRVAIISVQGPHVTVELEEGRNRQLRRTFGALGYGITRLHRTHAGSFILGNLPPSHWIETDSSGHVPGKTQP